MSNIRYVKQTKSKKKQNESHIHKRTKMPPSRQKKIEKASQDFHEIKAIQTRQCKTRQRHDETRQGKTRQD